MQKTLKHPPAQDRTNLLQALTDACKKAGGQNPGAAQFSRRGFAAPDVSHSPAQGISASPAPALHTLAEELNGLVVKDARFPGAGVRMLRDEGRGAKTYPEFAGNLLIQRALKTGSPEAAIKWLQKVLTTGTATGKAIHLLLGAPVDREIQLTKDVRIVPFADIPDSAAKQSIADLHQSAIFNPLNFKPPESVLIEGARIEPFTYDPDRRLDFSHGACRQSHALLREVALALTLAGPRACISASGWFSFDDPELNDARTAATDQWGHVLGELPAHNADYPILDPQEAQSIVQGYLALKGKTRAKTRMALRHLNQALQRFGAAARSAELAAIFEALPGDNAEPQIADRITMGPARLACGDDDSEGGRKRHFDIIRQACQIRRAFICRQRVDEAELRAIDGEMMTVRRIADHAVIIAADMIGTIIRRGEIPGRPDFDIAAQA